jgi:curli biogenesis system outer membrane secretion channel CsgG
MKRLLGLILVLLLVSNTVTFGQARKRIALLDFEFGSIQHWWSGNWDIGKGIADMTVTNLVKDGTFSVIERKKLDSILQEQNFSNSDRANPTSAAKIG